MKNTEIRIETGTPEELKLETEEALSMELGGAIPVPENDYEKLKKKPRINGVELIGNLKTDDLEITEDVIDQIPPMENLDIEAIFQSVFNS